MRKNYVLSQRAREDLDGIDEYTFLHWGAVQAEVYLRRLQQHIEVLGLQPAAGRLCPEYRPGYFKTRCGAHVVFYRLRDGVVEVVRILHESMDFRRHF